MLTVIIPIIVMLILAMLTSCILMYLQHKFKSNDAPLIASINKLLPQTQCGQCNYPGCLPYAKAINNLEADINRCPPGGQQTIDNIANLLNINSKPLAADLKPTPTNSLVARINEAECIGCILCIKACPVAAIVGASKQMHTVIADLCTGCDLCIPVCPMDCISMVEKDNKIKYLITPNPLQLK
jgi:electron transport complex protein RnfB